MILQNIEKDMRKLSEEDVEGSEVNKAVSAKIVGCHIDSRIEHRPLLLMNVHLKFSN